MSMAPLDKENCSAPFWKSLPLVEKLSNVLAGKSSPPEKKCSKPKVPARESPVPQVAAQDTTKTSVSISGTRNQNYAKTNTNSGQNSGNGNTYHMSQSKAPAAETSPVPEPPPVPEEADEVAKYAVRISGSGNIHYGGPNTNRGQNSGNGNEYHL